MIHWCVGRNSSALIQSIESDMKMKSYSKGSSGSMTSPVGMCSHKSNPMKQPARTSSECGPGANADQRKANKLLKKAHAEKDSLRGKSGM